MVLCAAFKGTGYLTDSSALYSSPTRCVKFRFRQPAFSVGRLSGIDPVSLIRTRLGLDTLFSPAAGYVRTLAYVALYEILLERGSSAYTTYLTLREYHF